jgi:hypothetical protein
VLISAVPPIMVQSDKNPQGTPKKVFDDFQAQLAANRPGFYRDIAAGPFYSFNRPGVEPQEAPWLRPDEVAATHRRQRRTPSPRERPVSVDQPRRRPPRATGASPSRIPGPAHAG